jgi:hypothetical protein
MNEIENLPKSLTIKQEEISPAVWYVYEDDVKLCITNEANAKFFVALNDAVAALRADNARLAAEVEQAREVIRDHGFISSLDLSSGKSYMKCRSCHGDNMGDANNYNVDEVKHYPGCRVSAALHPEQPE